MQSNHKNFKLPMQTKIVFGFIIVLTISLVFKWAFFTAYSLNKMSQIDKKFSDITGQVNVVCLKEESKSIKNASEPSEEDQDWMSQKAPEYCRCVSTRLVSHWSEKEQLEQLNQKNGDELSQFITFQLKNEDSKVFIDFCLSRAQKVSGKIVTASAAKN